MQFKIFLEKTENVKNIQDALKKIPQSHANLIKDYKIVFEPNNTLKKDNDHIGFIDEEKKIIKIAAPWNYGREYTFLHEIAHAVWKYFVNSKQKKIWSRLIKKAKENKKEGLDQNEEEIFCMIYAQHYAKNKISKFNHPTLEEFIKLI
jgi:hypothetical protein